MNIEGRAAVAICTLSLIVASACAVAPRYQPPEATLAPAYKEAGNWKPAEPSDQVVRGDWWQIFHDEQLNALEERVSSSNQTLKSADAQFEQARALVRSARAGYAPQLTTAPAATAQDQSQNRPLRNRTAPTRFDDYFAPIDVSYEADLWHRVHETVQASEAAAAGSAADRENINLSLHAELALDYFNLRRVDAEKELLDSTVVAYERAAELTENRFRGGIAAGADVAQAETQLEQTRTQAIDIQIQRAQLEHAIAVLTGQQASMFSLPPAPLNVPPPPVPPGLPSDLLERRPDVAGAERRIMAANAQVGIRSAAFYPILTLTSSTGLESASIGNWLRSASSLWSIGPAAAMTVFDGGRRRALSNQAKAAYDQSISDYRETVLNALREVEDNLAALRILGDEATTQQAATSAAERSLELSTNRYKGGVVTYLEVIAAQSAALANERAAVDLQMRQLTTSVLLVKALGGTWTGSRAP
jgi:NodT family efflux transporter outer membrane factor (OMF) lipoprotein